MNIFLFWSCYILLETCFAKKVVVTGVATKTGQMVRYLQFPAALYYSYLTFRLQVFQKLLNRKAFYPIAVAEDESVYRSLLSQGFPADHFRVLDFYSPIQAQSPVRNNRPSSK